MSSQYPQHISPFDAIRHQNEQENEYWSARELYKLLGYSSWERFQGTIDRAKSACEEAKQVVDDHFHIDVKMIVTGKGAKRKTSAQGAGVIEPRDFAIFQDHGYRGLYGGESARDIKVRKGLSRTQDILDWMNSDELAANAFRASLTRQKIDREHIKGKDKANQTHLQMGREVRDTIIRTGATLPEEMPTPDRSIQQLQRQEQLRIEQNKQPSLFDLGEEEQ